MSEITVAPYDGTTAAWDAFVRAQAGWTHYHLHGWRQVMERSFGHQCLYLEARDASGALAGVLPLVRVKSLLFGHFLVSMPFLNYGGPLGTPEAVRALAAHAERLAGEGGAKLLELRSRIPLPLGMEPTHRKITVMLELANGDSEALWKQIPSRVRNQIRKPLKHGVQVRIGHDQVGAFHAVFAHHMRDLGTPTMPLAFFEEIASAFPDAVFACAYVDGLPVAGGCAFLFDDQMEIVWGAALRAHHSLAPNMLLYWTFMEHACRAGARWFNFGRCTPGSRTHRFKRQWGAQDEPLWWYAAARAGGPTKTPTPEDGAYAWGPRVWKRLPLPVATALGPRIVKFIP